MTPYRTYFWKKTPFLKLLLPFIAGIIVQKQFHFSDTNWWIVFFAALMAFCSFFFIQFFKRYKFAFANGLIATILFFCLGILLTWQKDIRNNKQWLGNFYKPEDIVVATLEEPLVEKAKSFKAAATVSYLLRNGTSLSAKGKIILYFKKDSTPALSYGSQILLKKPLQEIKNSGNPGGFDYKGYCLFQGITHQVYLAPEDYETLQAKNEYWLNKFIYASRQNILNILKKNIKGDKELGLAEALLIGYKNDLEQSLVQSYTNTGVVHIIAISGLHLGLIYWLLALVLKPLQKRKKIRWLRPVIIITVLWLFSLLAGAQPSILRSALMFTCIVLGESLSRRTSIYNTMALSAFLLLCINPFWLWDVGFQLSYAAVLSIIIFMLPVYNLFYIKNKILDTIWKLNAVTIAAQILTVPLSIYHFHQFPNLFLLTNFLAVPLSSAILLGEILLCAIAFIPALALLVGKLLSWLIWLMNTYIEKIEAIKFSLWDGLQISVAQAILLLLFTVGISNWLMEKSARGMKLGLLCLLGFASLRTFYFIESRQQQKIIVYNVPQKRAIDIVTGNTCQFIGDSDLLTNDFARNFHLKPSRILHRVKEVEKSGPLYVDENYFTYQGKHILLVDESVSFAQSETKPVIDLLIISKKPKLYMKKIAGVLDIKKVVFDGSVPAWKTRYWKKDCDSLHIPWHDVTMKGAFVMTIN